MAPTPQQPTVPQALGRLRVALNASFERASRELGLTPQQAELLCAAMAPGAAPRVAAAIQIEGEDDEQMEQMGTADRDLVRGADNRELRDLGLDAGREGLRAAGGLLLHRPQEQPGGIRVPRHVRGDFLPL